MGTCNGHVVCMSVAYKLDYSIEKAIQFEKKSNGVVIFDSVNKVKIGQLTKEMSYTRKELDEEHFMQMFFISNCTPHVTPSMSRSCSNKFGLWVFAF